MVHKLLGFNQVTHCQTTIWRQFCSHSVSLVSLKFLTSPYPTKNKTRSLRQLKKRIRGPTQTTLQHPLRLKHKEHPLKQNNKVSSLFFAGVKFPKELVQTWSQEGGNLVWSLYKCSNWGGTVSFSHHAREMEQTSVGSKLSQLYFLELKWLQVKKFWRLILPSSCRTCSLREAWLHFITSSYSYQSVHFVVSTSGTEHALSLVSWGHGYFLV